MVTCCLQTPSLSIIKFNSDPGNNQGRLVWERNRPLNIVVVVDAGTMALLPICSLCQACQLTPPPIPPELVLIDLINLVIQLPEFNL